MRSDERKAARNRNFKAAMKDSVKTFVKLVKADKVQEATTMLPKVVSTIDKAAKKNIIHQNNAANKKSKLAKMVSSK